MRKNNSLAIEYLVFFSIFLVGILGGLFLWDKIILPYHNTWGVLGPLAIQRYNPMNNLVRFLVLVSLPSLLLFALYLLTKNKLNNINFLRYSIIADNSRSITQLTKASKIAFSVVLFLFVVLMAIRISIPNELDTFHEGESLGVAISFLAGKIPYKDYIFCHGLFQDPMRSVVAFGLFGKAIGSVRAFEIITRIIVFILLTIFILKIYRENYLFTIGTITILSIFAFTSVISIHYSRDITLYSFLITIPFLHRFITNNETSVAKFSVTIFFFSFIPIASFAYSIDRAFYLFASFIIISPVIYFFFFRKTIFNLYYILFSLAGILSALLLLFFAFGGNLTEFVRYTFVIMPKYKELLDGSIFPVFEFRYLVISAHIAANMFWIVFKFIQEYHHQKQLSGAIKTFVEKYLIEFCLFVLSIFFFRSALGRTDWSHVLYTSHITFILSVYIIFKHYFYKFKYKKIYYFILIGILSISSIVFVFQLGSNKLFSKAFPLKTTDSEFIPTNYKATISFLKDNLNNSENFFTMTSEASWYYFINKPCPTRFPVVWFAAPYFYQQEIVRDLEKNNVKYILYKNNYWSNHIDSIDNEQRIPIVTNHIKKNFVFLKKIDDNEIWINKKELNNNRIE